jgi:hypothetical protein
MLSCLPDAISIGYRRGRGYIHGLSGILSSSLAKERDMEGIS